MFSTVITVLCFVSQFVSWEYCYTHCTGEKTGAQEGFGIHQGYLPSEWLAVSTPISPFHVHAAGQSSFTTSNQRCSLFPKHAVQPLVNHFPSLSPNFLIRTQGRWSLLGRATTEQIK